MYLIVNSRNRLPNSVSSSDFYANTDRLNDNVEYGAMRLIHATIAGSFYNVNQYNNNLTVEVVYNDAPNPPEVDEYYLIIPQGNYSITTLRAVLETQLKALPYLNGATVEANMTTGKYTFKTNDVKSFIRFKSTGTNLSNSIMEVIGFDLGTDTASANTLVAPYVVDFSANQYIYIHCNASRRNVFTDQLQQGGSFSDIVAVLPINGGSWDNVVVEPIRPMVIKVNGFAEMQFRITDQQHRTLDLDDQNVTLVFELI